MQLRGGWRWSSTASGTGEETGVEHVTVLRQRRPAYRRDSFTWLAFAGLFTVGLFQAGLGPALPYLRAAEHISYLPAALLQAAFAVGGGTAGLLSAARMPPGGRTVVIRTGLAGMAVAGIGLAYAGAFALSVTAAFVMSLLGTSATIRLWAGLADRHRAARTIAMTEGEVAVSIGGIIMPFAVSGAAATVLGWASAFMLGAVVAAGVVLVSLAIRVPAEAAVTCDASPQARQAADRHQLPPMLVVVFAVVALEWALSFWLASYLSDDVHLGRGLAVALVSVLYAANLAGRLTVSRLARRTTPGQLLASCLATAFCGLPLLLFAGQAVTAAVGVAVAGLGIGASFPLTSSLHVGTSTRTSTVAVGQVMATAAIGQLAGPLVVGAVGETTSLRTGLITLPVLVLLAAIALVGHVHAHGAR